MTKKLYVDHFSPDKSMAMTTNTLSVSYNLAMLDRFNDQSSPVFSAGKYICMVVATDENKANMFFFDVRVNPENMNEFFSSNEYGDKFKMKLKSLVEMVNADYDRNSKSVELVLGASPAKPL
jgi:hypothetical protein